VIDLLERIHTPIQTPTRTRARARACAARIRLDFHFWGRHTEMR